MILFALIGDGLLHSILGAVGYENVREYILPAGHDGLTDRLPRSGKKINPSCPLRLRGSYLSLSLNLHPVIH